MTDDLDRKMAEYMEWDYDDLGGIGSLNAPCYIREDNSWMYVKDWHPTTDIAQAMEVAEKIMENMMIWIMPEGISVYDQNYRPINIERTGNLSQDTALAICKAIEKVKGGGDG